MTSQIYRDYYEKLDSLNSKLINTITNFSLTEKPLDSFYTRFELWSTIDKHLNLSLDDEEFVEINDDHVVYSFCASESVFSFPDYVTSDPRYSLEIGDIVVPFNDGVSCTVKVVLNTTELP